MKTISRYVTAATLGIGLLAAQTAGAVTIHLAHVDPAGWQTSKKGAAAEVFKNLVENRSGGDITVKVFPGGSLGDETALLQQVQSGAIAMAMASASFPRFCPAATVLDIPYSFPSAPVAWEVLDGQFGDELAAHCLEETGMRTLGYGETGFRHFTNNVREITSPSDLEGLKIRVIPTPIYRRIVAALGGEPTPVAWTELPTALSTGTVDGQENPVSVIVSAKLYELQDYITLDGHIYAADFLVINEEFYQGLTESQRTIVRNAGKIAGNVGRAIQQFNSARGLTTLDEVGMEITTLTAEELEAFRSAARPPVAEYVATQIDSTWIDKLDAAIREATSE